MSRIRSMLAGLITSESAGRLVRGRHELARRLRGEPHRVIFFHRVNDAWSALLAQRLGDLTAVYDLQLDLRLISTLPIDCVPDPQRLDDYAAYDAVRLAHAWGLEFDDRPVPDGATSHLADRIILSRPASLTQLQTATAAAWRGDLDRLAVLAHDAIDEQETGVRLAENQRELHRLGHYLGGMLWYQGEWFWGLDRLALLEQRLRDRIPGHRGLTLQDSLFNPLERRAAGSALPLDLEFYFSFRSPYSYLGAIKAVALADRLGLNLQLRPLLPMVSRGIPVPGHKLRYIIRDVARIARAEGIAFGPIRDPLGKGVENCLALFHYAEERGAGREFLLAAMRAIWCEGADLRSRATLDRLGKRCGLGPAATEGALADKRWRARVEANAATLAVLGLWGVPGFCLRNVEGQPLSVAWGQDRLWAIERAALGVDVAMPPPRLVQ